MTARTDIHRPSAIVPLDYEYVGVFYQGVSEDMADAYRDDHRELDHLLGEDWDRVIGVPDGNYKTKSTCDHCGSAFAHGVVYRHRPTGELLVVGHICGQQTLLPATDQAGQRRKLAEREAQRLASLRANEEYRQSKPELLAAFALAHEDRFQVRTADWHVSTLLDIERRFRSSYPELSEKQEALVLRLAEELPGKLDEQARRDAENAAAENVPTGRVEIVGEILSRKETTNDFGFVTKVTVKDDRGFRVYGTLPSAIEEAKRGDRVSFTAAVEPSKDDPKFGFYKRPTKASVL